ncbi:MAG TPA: helix-turn-helix domain-containing protein [Vicinamibacteria bacterium]
MPYRERPPLPALRPWVECVWSIEGGDEDEKDAVERILPDGCPELVAHLGAPFARCEGPGRWQRQPRLFLVGPLTRFLLIRSTGVPATVGVRFRPAGASAFFPQPMAEIRDTLVALEDLWGARARRLEDRLLHAPAAGRGGLLEAALTAARRPECSWARSVHATVNEIVQRRGAVSVASLARGAAASPRQLERRFAQAVGVGPRMLARIMRFQHVFELRHGAPAGWAALAADGGFFDQPHLIRDFRTFSGQAPSELLGTQGALSRAFTSPERLAALFAG